MSKRVVVKGLRPVGAWDIVSGDLVDSRTRISSNANVRAMLGRALDSSNRTRGKADDVLITETLSVVMTRDLSGSENPSNAKRGSQARTAITSNRPTFSQQGPHRSESSGGNLFPPRVIGVDRSLAVGAAINVRELFKFSDIEGNRLNQVSVIDNSMTSTSGFWTYQGRRLESGRWYTYNDLQLKDLFFVGGLELGVDKLQIRASDTDGVSSRWSQAAVVDVTTIPANRRPPTVNVNPIRTIANETIDAGRYISANDPDGYAITQYRVRLLGTGKLVLGNLDIAAGVWRTISADDLAKLMFVAPGFSTGTKSAKLEVQAYDSRFWSSVTAGSITIAANSAAPVAHAVDVTLPIGTEVAGHEFFGFSDSNDNTLKRFALFDEGAGGGFFTVNGVQMAAGQWFEVAAEDLHTVAYQGAGAASSENFRVRVYDGRYWSDISSASVSTVAKPIVAVNGEYGSRITVADAQESIQAADLFQTVDGGPAATQFQIIDLNPAVLSGRFVLNGQTLEAGKVHTISAGAMPNLFFVGGREDNRHLDDFRVRAFNGSEWSDWVGGAVHTEPKMIKALDQLGSWSALPGTGVTLTYSFMNTVPGYYPDDAQERTNFIPANQLMRDAFRQVLESYAAISGLRFVEVPESTGGVIRLGTADLGDTGILGWAYGPGAMSSRSRPGDVWVNNESVLKDTADDPFINQDKGSISYLTLVHELGHAVGLSHPFDGFYRLPAATDNRIFTVMSYAAPPSGLEPWTPQLYDIAAIQSLYGRNLTSTDGDDIYRFEANEPTVQTVWDVAGKDTIDFSNQTIDVSADLRSGRFTSIADEDFAINIAYGTVIENLRGGRGNDVLNGNYVGNQIFGGVGNDILRGWGGNDRASGGAGNDTYIYGLGDGSDFVDETNNGGTDVMRFDLKGIVGMGAGEETLRQNFVAKKVGLDLHLLLKPVGSDQLGSVIIRNMGAVGSRVETLQMFDGIRKIGRNIDLASLYLQAGDMYRRFAVTNYSTDNGQIVTPV